MYFMMETKHLLLVKLLLPLRVRKLKFFGVIK